jgi:hypothetical protein
MSHRETLDAYFAGVNDERFDDVANLFGERGELRAPGTAPRIGAAAIADYFRAALKPYPIHRDQPTRFIDAGATFTVEIHFTGETTAGMPLEFDAVDVFDFAADGTIALLTSWYDSHAVRRQLRESRRGEDKNQTIDWLTGR